MARFSAVRAHLVAPWAPVGLESPREKARVGVPHRRRRGLLQTQWALVLRK